MASSQQTDDDQRSYSCTGCEWTGRRVVYELGEGAHCPECDSDVGFVEDDTVRNSVATVSLTADLFENLRQEPFYIGPDALGTPIHISKDSQSLGQIKGDDGPDHDAWAPIFPVKDTDTPDGTEPVADAKSKTTMLEATPEDTIEITKVHAGTPRIPEQYTVVKRVNTYAGPVLKLKVADAFDGQEHGWELHAPDRRSNLMLWRAVADHEDMVHTYTKIAEVSAQIFNVAGYDFCPQCDEPIKDPMHRSMALLGQCTGGFNDSPNASLGDSDG